MEHLLKTCTSATLSISNQKNGKCNQSIHQEAITGDTCPVKALIRRVKHIRAHTSRRDTVLGTYFASTSHKGRILGESDMNTALKQAVKDLGLARNGILPEHVGSHGGAMAMHLNKVETARTIKKMGRWSSDIFLMYIRHVRIAIGTNQINWPNRSGENR